LPRSSTQDICGIHREGRLFPPPLSAGCDEPAAALAKTQCVLPYHSGYDYISHHSVPQAKQLQQQGHSEPSLGSSTSKKIHGSSGDEGPSGDASVLDHDDEKGERDSDGGEEEGRGSMSAASRSDNSPPAVPHISVAAFGGKGKQPWQQVWKKQNKKEV